MATAETAHSAALEDVWAWPEPAASYEQTTRQLCGAVELNPTFAGQVLEIVDDAPCRAIAPSPGVDLVPVVGHALAARRRLVLRDVILLLVLAATGLAALAASPRGAVVAGLLAGWVVVFAVAWHGYRAAARLRHAEFDPAAEHESVRRHAQADAIREAQEGNVAVYSGFSPFLGSGAPLGGWSFAADLTAKRPDGRATVASFPLGDLYGTIEDALAELPGVRVERRLFVDGQDVRADRRFLRDPVSRPTARVPDALVAQVREEPETTVRYLTCVRIVDWQGDLVVSAFVRLVRVADTLYTEVTYALLPPVKDSLRGVDALAPGRRADTIAKLVAKALGTALVRLPLAPLFALGHAQDALGRRNRRKQLHAEIARAANYDYGAQRSVRELAAEGYRRYFQLLDKEMYLKVVERTTLDAIVRFLDAHGVDTSELKQRGEAILNQGVIISGGEVKFENTSIGRRAQLTVNRAAASAREAA